MATRSTNPYDNNIDLSTSEGLKLWTAATSVDSTVSRLALKVENGEAIRKRVTKKSDQYRLNRILRVPTGGNGVPAGTRGAVAATNFTGPRKLLDEYHNLTLQQVQAWAAYNWGANDDPRVEPPTDMEIKALDFTAADASLERANMKQQYRIRSELLFVILQNAITEEDYDLLSNDSDDYTFEDPRTGDTKSDGVIFLWKILNEVKPSTVIDVQDLETKLEEATLQKFENDVTKLTREMEKIWKEIKRLKPGTYSESRFLTQLFRALETTTNESFERTVETLKDMWILQDARCNVPYVIRTSCTKYVNLVSAHKWAITSSKDTKIIALTTALNEHKKKFNELKTKVESNGGQGGGSTNKTTKPGGDGKGKLKVAEWRIKFKGKTTTVDGKKWVWCKEHKSEGLFDGMYMPEGHNHDEWKKEKDAKVKAWKENRRSKTDKDEKTTGKGTPSQPNKLTLSNRLASALTTKLGVSDKDAKQLIEDAMKDSGKE